MPDINFCCPHCRQSIEAPEDMEGMSAECPTCKNQICIPAGSLVLTNSSKTEPVVTKAFSQTPNGNVVLHEVKCRNCGAQVAFDASKQLARCAFCGSEYALKASAENGAAHLNIQESYIVPLVIDHQKANAIFLKWIAKGFWKPTDLSQRFNKVGSDMVYVPFWVLNASVFTNWNGSYSQTHYRTVTKTRQVFRNNRTYDEQYVDNEPYTVWYPQNGEHAGNYWDFICATDALNQGETDKLGFDGKDFKPLRNEYLHGWQSAQPSVTEQQGIARAEQRMIQWEGAECRKLTERLENWVCRFTFHKSSIVYMPVWTFAYTYNKKSYRAIINGKTGRIFGKKPLSAIKIGIASIIGLAILAIIISWIVNSNEVASNTQPSPKGSESVAKQDSIPAESPPSSVETVAQPKSDPGVVSFQETKEIQTAPAGTYFLLERISISTDSGVIGFDPGTKVTLVNDLGESLRVTDGQTVFDVPKNRLTNQINDPRPVSYTHLTLPTNREV